MQGKGHKKGRKCKQCKGHQCIHENVSDESQKSAYKGISLAEQSMEILEKVLAEKEGLPEEILKLASKEELFQLGMDPVCIVAAMGHLDGTRRFVEAGANCNDKRSTDGSTPLMLATQNRHIDVVQLLLKHSADVTAVNNEGNNAFLVAIRTGDAKLVNAMWPYKGNLDINHQNSIGYTALHFAADKCWDACVQFLLANGADIDRQNVDGWTPLMLASMRGDVKVAERLLSTGADLLIEDNSGYTAVCHSADPDKEDVLDFFLSKVAEQNIKETFVKYRIERIKSPMAEDDLEDLLVNAVLPIIQKLTDRQNFRDVLAKLKVLPSVMSVVQKHMKLPEIILLSIHIMCLGMYCKDTDSVDDRFVKQFIKSRGCEFCLKALKLHNDSNKRNNDLLASCIFPIIIASQTVEGKSWIEKNNAKISTYSFLRNHFNNPSCMEDGKQIWIHFWDSFNGIQQEQREKKMAELLEEEDRERNRKVKRRERKKQKRQRQQQVKQRENTYKTSLKTADFDSNESKDSDQTTSNLSAGVDSDHINTSDSKSLSLLENSITTDISDVGFQNMKYKNTTKNAKSSKCRAKPKNFLNEVTSKQCSSHAMSAVSQENIWVKVQNRKTPSQSDASLASESYSMSQNSESTETITTETKSPEQSKKRWADIAKVQTSGEQLVITNLAANKSIDTGSEIKMKSHCDQNYSEGDYEYDFPSLDNKPSPTRASPERQVYGVTNSCSPTLDHWYIDDCPSGSSNSSVSQLERERYYSDSNIAESTAAKLDIQNTLALASQCLFKNNEYGSNFVTKTNNNKDKILNDSLDCGSSDVDTTKNRKRVTVSLHDIEHNVYDGENVDIKNQLEETNDRHFDVTTTTIPPCVTSHNDEFSESHETVMQRQRTTELDSSLASNFPNQIFNTIVNHKNQYFASQSAVERDHIRESMSADLKSNFTLHQLCLEKANNDNNKFVMQKNAAESEIERDWSIQDAMDMALLLKYKPNGFDAINPNIILSEGSKEKCLITSLPPVVDSGTHLSSKYSWTFADKQANSGTERNIYSQNQDALPTKATEYHSLSPISSYYTSHADKLASTNYTFTTTNPVPTVFQNTSGIKCNELKKNNVAVIQPMAPTTTFFKDQDVTKFDIGKPNDMNCYLGESLLRNVSNLQIQDDEVCYPSSLSGESEGRLSHGNGKSGFDIFPGFHENTAAGSIESEKSDFGFDDFKKIAGQQLQQYYNEVQKRGPVYGSLYYHDIPFYASCLGISEEELEKSFVFSSDRAVQNISKTATSDATRIAMETINPRTSLAFSQASNVTEMQCKEPYPYVLAQEYATDAGRVYGPNQLDHAQYIQNNLYDKFGTTNQIKTGISNCQVTTNPINGNGNDLESQHMASIKTVQPWIKRSRRWRQKLTAIINLPASCMRQLGDILIPVNTENFLVPYSDGNAILGFLIDGSEVLVHVIDVTVRTINSDILRSVTSPRTSQYFLIKYRTFAFENNCCYIAMDLPEYSLNEYLVLLKLDAHSDPMTVNKLAWQFLKGLSSLHRVLGWAHGNMMPSNMFVDVEGKLMLSEYSFVQPDSSKAKFHGLNAIEYDRSCWTPTEIITETDAYSIKSDLQVAGMILHYILSGGNHPYGEINLEIQVSIQQNWPKSTYISDEANGLISDMIVMPPAARPSMEHVLKHPYFWANEKRLRFVLIAGSDVLRDMKSGTSTTGGTGDTMIDIINIVGRNSIFCEWTSVVDHLILKEMRSFRQYKNTLVELVLFVYNCCLHFDKLSHTARDIIDEPCRYFLTTFPALFMAVFTAINNSNRAERVCYKPFF